MRTATTLIKTGKGWTLLSGPDKPLLDQKRFYRKSGAKWPEGATVIRYQPSDGEAVQMTKEKAIAILSLQSSVADRLKQDEEEAKLKTK